jgi:uncharacterized protein with von Willebrand factor type A (vWA) domain
MAIKNMIYRINSLSGQIVDFGRYLRDKGYDISADREAMALEAINLQLSDRQLFKYTLKSIFPTDKTTRISFDEHFEQYFKERRKAVDSKIKDSQKQKSIQKPNSEASFQSLKNWLYGKKNEEEELAAFGGDTILSKKDFSSYTETDIKESKKMIQNLVKNLQKKHGRRKIKVKKAIQPDLRLTMRKNLSQGTEINQLFFTEKKPKPTRLVLLTDVSRSMELYSRFFTQFMFAFKKVYSKIDLYVFSSDISQITDKMKGHDFQKTLQNLSDIVPHWSGGTKIGYCLDKFVSKNFNQKIDLKTIVMVVSDGLDTGDIEKLSASLKTIKKRAKAIVWINPLAGHLNYSPSTASMQAALPYLNLLSAGHNLESLKNVMLKLGKLG